MKNPVNALFNSLIMVFKHLFKKPITLEYPEQKRAQPDAFRGKPVVNDCVGCGICKKVCPSGAISYCKNFEGKVISYSIDLNKCIFCGNCAYYCPKGAIKMSHEYELATEDDSNLKLEYIVFYQNSQVFCMHQIKKSCQNLKMSPFCSLLK